MGKQFAQIGETPEKDDTEGKALNCIVIKKYKCKIKWLKKGDENDETKNTRRIFTANAKNK